MLINLLKSMRVTSKFPIFCIGSAKSGTNTMSDIWGPPIKTAHESYQNLIIPLILNREEGLIDDKRFSSSVIEIYREFDLDISSSQLNLFILDELLDIFPKAKFILTLRDPYSWLDSFINHQLSRPCNGIWRKFRDHRFRPHLFNYPTEENILKTYKLYTLDGYFSYWNYHNTKALNSVPPKRLLVVRTDQIDDQIDMIRRFVGFKRSTKINLRVHSNVARKKFNIPNQIDQQYLDKKVEKYCGSLLSEYFPEIIKARKLLHF